MDSSANHNRHKRNYFCYERHCFIEEDGIRYTLRKDDVLFLEKGKPHGGFKESSGVEFYWIHFKNNCNFKLKTVDGKRLSILCRQLLHYEYTPAYPKESSELSFRLIKIMTAEQLNQCCEPKNSILCCF